MLHYYGFWSILPPVLAITLAIATRQVFVSLFAGIWVGFLVVHSGNPLLATTASLDACVQVFTDPGNTRVVLFCAMVGSLIALLQRGGGVDGFIDFMQRSQLVRGRRSAGTLALAVGMMIFIETSISCLVTGAIGRPMFDRLKMSREKLAYVCDTCSAPICLLIPLNGWGAFVLAQLAGLGAENPVSLMLAAIPYHFYAWLSIIILAFTVITDRDFGPMRRAQRRAREEGKLHADGARPMVSDEVIAIPRDGQTPPRAINMIVPILILVALVPAGIAYTGLHNLPADFSGGTSDRFWAVLRNCSGSTAVFWAVSAAVVATGVLLRFQGIMMLREFVEVSFKGAGALAPLAVLMVLAFAIGSLCKNELRTGDFVASFVGDAMPAALMAPVIFITASAIAFSTGTSWGTFAIMLPIAWALAEKTGVRPELAVSAVLSGGVFGDHCSPISDTTIVASMASASDHIDHVRTQLPYALVAGAAATVLYAVVAATM